MKEFFKKLGRVILILFVAFGQHLLGLSSIKPKPESFNSRAVAATSLTNGKSAPPPDGVSSGPSIDEIKQDFTENVIDVLDAVTEEERKKMKQEIEEANRASEEANSTGAEIRSIYDT